MKTTRHLHLVLAGVILAGCHQTGSNGISKTLPSVVESTFQPTIENRDLAPAPAPEGMVWIPGGEFSMGASDPPDMNEVGMNAMKDARPIHRVYVDGFFMDKTDVTNEQFSRFVQATGYMT